VHNNHNLGVIIKTARNNKSLTQEQLAEKLGIGSRHIMGIENEGKAPSFDVLYDLVRELNILSDSIFYPEKRNEDSALDYLMRLLPQCSKQQISAITALVEQLIDDTE